MKIDRIRIKLSVKIISISYAAATVYFKNKKYITLNAIGLLIKKWAYMAVYTILGFSSKKRQIKLHTFFFADIKPNEISFDQSISIIPEISGDPAVSIIINGLNCPDSYIKNCLNAIANNIRSTTYELILITDHHTELPQVIRQIHSKKFSNKSLHTTQIKGEYVFLMSGYHQPISDFLADRLHFLKVACALTSKVIFASNGLLKSAGASLQNQTYFYTALYSNPNEIAVNYVKPVDLAAETLFVKTSDFLSFEQLDLEKKSWEFNIAALSNDLRKATGKLIYYHPLQAFLTFNDKLSAESVTIDIGDTNCVAPKRDSILVIDAVYPTPDKDSGSRRLFELIKILLSIDLNVYFIAHEAITSDKYYNALVNLGVRVFKGSYHKEKQFSQIQKYLSEISYVWISRPDMNQIYGPRIKQLNNNIKWIYDTVDLHFIREERAKKIESTASLVIDSDIEKLKEKELGIASLADYTITVTDVEKVILENLGISKVYTVPNVHPQNLAQNGLPFRNRHGIVFIGSYLHQPNIDAVVWLINEIMPIVWHTHPNLHVALLGSNPTQDVIDLASNRVSIPGFIEDVSPYFLNSRIFVAPLRFGAGMKGKIGQSLEFGLPVVSTDIGVEGMYLVDEQHCLVANDAQAFADKIIRVYDNEILWSTLHENSLKAIAKYSPAAVTAQLKDILFSN